MNRSGAVAIALGLLVSGCAISPNSKPAVPIQGTWSYRVPDSDCTEIYVFNRGTRTFTSNEEHGTSSYLLIHSPDPNGLPQIQDTIVSTNRGTDCSGGRGAPVGDTVTVYLRFATPDQMAMCRSQSEDSCFGPFVRVR